MTFVRVGAVSVVTAMLLVAGPARAAETLPGPIPAEVLHVYDGDTLVVRARVWLGQDVTIRIRLAGLDAPELRGRCAAERTRAAVARSALAARAPVGGRVMLVDVRYGKYAGRVLARVIDGDGADIGAALITAGHARAYDGRTRATWCGARTAAR